MSKSITTDFRETFTKMADLSVITRAELASLLATSEGAVSQMAYRGELPKQAFPEKRRAVWFVRDIRRWLDEMAVSREGQCTSLLDKYSEIPRLGRKRLPTGPTK